MGRGQSARSLEALVIPSLHEMSTVPISSQPGLTASKPSQEDVQTVLSGFQALLSGSGLKLEEIHLKPFVGQNIVPSSSAWDESSSTPVLLRSEIGDCEESQLPIKRLRQFDFSRAPERRNRMALAQIFSPTGPVFSPVSVRSDVTSMLTNSTAVNEDPRQRKASFWEKVFLDAENHRKSYPECILMGTGSTSALTSGSTSLQSASSDGRTAFPCQVSMDQESYQGYEARSTQKSGLTPHLDSHGRIRIFPCLQCDAKFDQKIILRDHMRAEHERNRPHPCNQCNLEFSQRSALQMHVRTVHERQRPFHCEQCESTFGHRGDLNRHIRVVHEKLRPFSCRVCGSNFGRKSVLNRHIIKVHNQSPQRSS